MSAGHIKHLAGRMSMRLTLVAGHRKNRQRRRHHRLNKARGIPAYPRASTPARRIVPASFS